MNIKLVLKLAENLFNDGFVASKTGSGTVYNVATGESQNPPQEVVDILEFLCEFSQNLRSKVSLN